MNFDHYVRAVRTIHIARLATSGGLSGFIVSKCGRAYLRRDPGVYTVKEFMALPAVARHLADCEQCQTRRWKPDVRKAGE